MTRAWLLIVAACGSSPPTPPTAPAASPPPAVQPPVTDAACIPPEYAAAPITMAGEGEAVGFVCYSIVGDLVGPAEEAATVSTRKCFAVDARGALVEELTRAEMRAREAPVPSRPSLKLTHDRAKVCMPDGACTEVAIERGPKDTYEASAYIGATDAHGRYVITLVPEPEGELHATLFDVAKGTRLGSMKLATPEAPHAFRDRSRTRGLDVIGRAALVAELTEPSATAVFDIVGGKARYLHGSDGVTVAMNDHVLASRNGDTLQIIDTDTLATVATARVLGSEVPHFFIGTVRNVGNSFVLFFGENPPNVTVVDTKTLQVTPARAFRICATGS